MSTQPDLFAPPPPSENTRPKTPDWWLLIAQQRGVPEGWRWVSLETIDTKVPREQAHCMLTGAVYSTLLKSGPRKGQPNFNKPDAGTERRLVISFAELDAFCAQWERAEGMCSRCIGTGEELVGTGNPEGNPYRTCSRCKGTGKPTP